MAVKKYIQEIKKESIPRKNNSHPEENSGLKIQNESLDISKMESIHPTVSKSEINTDLQNDVPATNFDAIPSGHTFYIDSYFEEAGKLITENDKASIGMLQRVFKISFNHASCIMDQLSDAGVVGPEEGTKPRKVLMTMKQFEQLLNKITLKQEKQKDLDTDSEPKLTLEDIENILKEKLLIECDFSNDGKPLKNLKNIIIPSETNEKQIDIINTLLRFNSPKTLKLILIDNSIINYSIYNGIPQLLIPVISDTHKTDAIINWCFAEMENRIKIFVDNHVKNIDSYNEKINNIPRIVCIVNEASDFFKYTSRSLERLFMTSNMTGIYFILFSRFSLKSLSLGMIGELLEPFTTDELHILLLQTKNTSNNLCAGKSFDNMDGHEFEHFCASILEKNGFKSVNVTKGSGDQGIDIVAIKEGVKYGIQCKCYSSNIQNKAVQEAIAGKKFYDCHVGVVLTNQYFTKPAKELAEKTGILLWDRSYLEKLINNLNN